MMMTTPPDDLGDRPRDFLAMGIRAIVGGIPIVGSALVEVASFIPKQQQDRIVDYVRRLNTKVGDLEEEVFRERMKNERFADLHFEALKQAAESLSEERREYIANLVANSVTVDEIECQERRFLLGLLGQINDVQVILLNGHAFRIAQDAREFRDRHKELMLRSSRLHVRASQEQFEVAAIQKGFKDRLAELGLLEYTHKVESANTNGGDIRKQVEKAFKPDGYKLSRMGALLLKNIGLIDSITGF